MAVAKKSLRATLEFKIVSDIYVFRSADPTRGTDYYVLLVLMGLHSIMGISIQMEMGGQVARYKQQWY